MGDLGAVSMVIALALAAYAVVASLLGAARRYPQLVQSGRYATYLTPVVLAVAIVSLVTAFLQHDFSLSYIALHSNRAMEPRYLWVAFYSGNEGSMLFIAFVLAVMTTLVVATAPKVLRDSLPYTNAIAMVVLTFLLALMVSLADPFARLAVPPPDGRGINPLLTHPGMFIHPPIMMTGLLSVTFPFAFAIGALMARKVGDEWVDAGRTWGLVAWTILSLGNLLGAWWAYTILGWGGYWAWDPVENAGIMAWFPLTAFIHSIMVQKRRGMFRMWNIVLIMVAFALAQYGMFMNRGGPVPSVHSFAQSTMGWSFLIFMGFSIVAPLGVFFMRYKELKSAASLESTLSREAAFLANNFLFLSIAFAILWGVTFPLISEATKGVPVTVARPYYDQVAGPLLMALVFFMGVGPLLPWRHANLASLRKALLFPAAVALGVAVLLLALGMRSPYAVASFSLCALVVAGVTREVALGTWARSRKGENPILALGRLIAANRPRYGGYIVHLGIVLLALGVTASSFFDLQKDAFLKPGDTASVGPYTVEYLGASFSQKPDRTEAVAQLRAYKDGRLLGVMEPWRAFYPEWRMGSTRAAIRSTPIEDFYVVPSEFQQDGSAAFRLYVNPMVMWMWVAGPVIILGALVSLWPSRAEARVTVGALAGSPATVRVR